MADARRTAPHPSDAEVCPPTTRWRWPALAALLAATALAAPSSALAQTPAQTINAINSAGLLTGVIATGTTDSDSASITTAAATTVDIPKRATDQLAVTNSAGDQIKLGVPAPTTTDAVRTSSGSVVYPAAASGTSTTAQALSNGDVRLLITIPNAAAPHDYAVPVTLPANSQGVLLANGAIAFADTTGRVFGQLKTPLAIDAKGNRLPTYFRINNGIVTQHIEFSASTAFPIVADHWYSNPFAQLKQVINYVLDVFEVAIVGCVKWGIVGAIEGAINGGWTGAQAGAVSGCIRGAGDAVSGYTPSTPAPAPAAPMVRNCYAATWRQQDMGQCPLVTASAYAAYMVPNCYIATRRQQDLGQCPMVSAPAMDAYLRQAAAQASSEPGGGGGGGGA